MQRDEEFIAKMSQWKPLSALRLIALRLALPSLAISYGSILMGRAGHLLQQMSVQTVGGLLGVFYRVHIDGLRILLCGKNILPDQPHSSALTAFVMLTFFVLLVWIRRPKPRQAVMSFWLVLFLTYAVNVSRTFILATGSAFPNLVGHIDVSVILWHDLISGLTLLMVGLFPLAAWSLSWQSSPHLPNRNTLAERPVTPASSAPISTRKPWRQVGIWLACSLVAIVLILCSAPTTSSDLHQAAKTRLGKPFSMVFQKDGFHPLSIGLPVSHSTGGIGLRHAKAGAGHRLASNCRVDAKPFLSITLKQGDHHASRFARKAKASFC